MIIEGLLDTIIKVLTFILDLLPDLPQVPVEVTSAVDTFMNLIFDNVRLLGVFIPLGIVKIIIPLWLGIEAFDKIYALVFWVIRKIPMLNIRE